MGVPKISSFGVEMARKPNYGFERREREKAKAEKKAERLAARQKERETEDGAEAEPGTQSDAEIGTDRE